MEHRPFKIDGYPVSRQEVLDQARIISGHVIVSMRSAKKVLADDGREVTEVDFSAEHDRLREALLEIDAVATDNGHYENAARTMKEIAVKALYNN